MGYVDSHCHIAEKEFDATREAVLDRCKTYQVNRVLIVCTSFEEIPVAQAICEKENGFYYATGLFPTEFEKHTEENFARLEKELDHPKCVALGEIGLDYYWDKDRHDQQKMVFRRQIELAKAHQKPILVHSRDAIQDTYDLISELRPQGVMHCYSDSKEMALEFVKLGFFISLAGPVTFKSSVKPKEVAKAVPLSHLLSETDSPYMAPEPVRGTPNEPSNVRFTAEFIASLREEPREEVLGSFEHNFDSLLKMV